MKLQIKKVKDTKTPEVGRLDDCGYDCFIPNSFCHFNKLRDTIEFYVKLKPHTQIKIPLGLCFNIPEGYGLFCFDRSSVSTKLGLKILAPVIDPSYTGEVSACVYNYTNKDIILKPGMKIIQLVLLPYIKPEIEIVDNIIKNTTRGDKGFGSTNL